MAKKPSSSGGKGNGVKSTKKKNGLNFEHILYDKKNRVAYVTINRPEVRNALNSEVREELAIAIEDAWLDDEIGVIVLTGAGGKAFSAGGDLSWIVDPKKKVDAKYTLVHYRLATAMRCCGKPIIARVDGYCVGGGNELNMLCDLTIASERSIFAQAGPLVGSAPIWYGLQQLQQQIHCGGSNEDGLGEQSCSGGEARRGSGCLVQESVREEPTVSQDSQATDKFCI
jgi:enoyl-CoA hydratase/carnithine racemase